MLSQEEVLDQKYRRQCIVNRLRETKKKANQEGNKLGLEKEAL